MKMVLSFDLGIDIIITFIIIIKLIFFQTRNIQGNLCASSSDYFSSWIYF